MVLFWYVVGIGLVWLGYCLVLFCYGVGIDLAWCWYGVGKVLVWFVIVL